MRGKGLRKSVLIIVIVIVLSIITWQLLQHQTSAEPLNEEAVKKIVNDLYQGEIQEVNLKEQVYNVSIKTETGSYDIMIDRNSSKILNILQTQVVELKNKDPLKEKVTAHTIITKEEARTIALEKVKGNVEDIDFEEEDDGPSYYTVEVERTDGMEATIQINAITGEIITISWDE